MATVKAIDVIKRNGQRPTESFERDKLHHSIHAACLSVRSADGAAVEAADKVCDIVVIWCEKRAAVTSDDIRRQAAKALAVFHPEAAYFYQHHRMIM
ncbi:hypothetical protein B7Z17_03105 [Candidatus Saccharibacteria bacterium 32-49-10]|nr:MAG: hypothetical protein B7Z17_03105 [Candidatus Saccharibacteria bacterium 32-49-10]